MVVTSAGDGRVYALADRPALDVYLDRLGAPAEAYVDEEAFKQFALPRPLGVQRRSGVEARNLSTEVDFEGRSIGGGSAIGHAGRSGRRGGRLPAGQPPSYGKPAAVVDRESAHLEVPGLGECPAGAASWSGGSLVVARWGDEPFSAVERNLVRGMARTLELTLRTLRNLRVETEMRERSERQAAENARLAESLREQQKLLMRRSVIQRAISRREPLASLSPPTGRSGGSAQGRGDPADVRRERQPRPDRCAHAAPVHLAVHDTLTGLASRGLFLERLAAGRGRYSSSTWTAARRSTTASGMRRAIRS